MILGIDEVGRGPWAGPLVVGAVVLNGAIIEGLTDSKKVAKKRREALYDQILASSATIGLGWVSAEEIDENGLSEALRMATRRAVEQINVPYQEIVIDGTVNFLAGTGKGPYVTTLKKADLLISAVSAASIVAKVARDDYMAEQDAVYPGYGFAAHAGYGTAAHKTAIAKRGVSPLHRRSFAPIAALMGENQPVKRSIGGTNKDSGNKGEEAAAEWLTLQGYEMLERNWKTRFCEIDLVTRKAGRYYFVEVKHRKTAGSGSGLDAITPAKHRRMRFAATVYQKAKTVLDKDAVLAVITTTGEYPTFETYLELE